MPTDAPRLSREGYNLQRSVMRDLLRFAVDPDVISLAGGLPASEHLPLEGLKECLDTVLSRDGPRALQYSPQHLPLRAWIAEYMGTRGVSCTAEEIFITNGNQHGLAILSRLFLDPGQPAVIEEVTFTGVHQITVGRDAEVRTLPTDLDTGVCVESFEEALKASPTPRLAVLITDFHNPLGVSIAEEKEGGVGQPGRPIRGAPHRRRSLRAPAVPRAGHPSHQGPRRSRNGLLPRVLLEDAGAGSSAGMDRGSGGAHGQDHDPPGIFRSGILYPFPTGCH